MDVGIGAADDGAYWFVVVVAVVVVVFIRDAGTVLLLLLVVLYLLCGGGCGIIIAAAAAAECLAPALAPVTASGIAGSGSNIGQANVHGTPRQLTMLMPLPTECTGVVLVFACGAYWCL